MTVKSITKRLSILFKIPLKYLRILFVPSTTEINLFNLPLNCPTKYSTREWFDGNLEKRKLSDLCDMKICDGDLLLLQNINVPLRELNEKEQISVNLAGSNNNYNVTGSGNYFNSYVPTVTSMKNNSTNNYTNNGTNNISINNNNNNVNYDGSKNNNYYGDSNTNYNNNFMNGNSYNNATNYNNTTNQYSNNFSNNYSNNNSNNNSNYNSNNNLNNINNISNINNNYNNSNNFNSISTTSNNSNSNSSNPSTNGSLNNMSSYNSFEKSTYSSIVQYGTKTKKKESGVHIKTHRERMLDISEGEKKNKEKENDESTCRTNSPANDLFAPLLLFDKIEDEDEINNNSENKSGNENKAKSTMTSNNLYINKMIKEKLNFNNDDLDAEHSPESSKEPSLGTDEVVDREGYDLFSDLN